MFVACAAPCFIALLEKCKTFLWVIWKTVASLFGKAVSWRECLQAPSRDRSLWPVLGELHPACCCKDGWVGGFPVCWVFPVWPVAQVLTGTKQLPMRIFSAWLPEIWKQGGCFGFGFFGELMCCWVFTIPWHSLAMSLLSFLDNLCVAKTSCGAQQTQQNPRLWSASKAASTCQCWLEQVEPLYIWCPVLLGADVCIGDQSWIFWARRTGVLRDKLGLDLDSWGEGYPSHPSCWGCCALPSPSNTTGTTDSKEQARSSFCLHLFMILSSPWAFTVLSP